MSKIEAQRIERTLLFRLPEEALALLTAQQEKYTQEARARADTRSYDCHLALLRLCREVQEARARPAPAPSLTVVTPQHNDDPAFARTNAS